MIIMGAPINANKQNSNLIQSVDWTRFSVEEWLEQYGLWVNDQQGRGVTGYHSVLGSWQSTQADRRRRDFRMRQCMLQVSDNEAQAVMRLLIDLKSVDAGIGAIVVAHIEQSRSFAAIAGMTQGQLSKTTVINRYRDGCEYLKKRMGLDGFEKL